MTNAQKWVAAVLFLFIVLFMIGRLTYDFDKSNDEYYSPSESETSSQAKELSGQELVANIGCTSCHGNGLTGTKLAPSLFSVHEYWTRDALINYLRNPSSYSGDERFEAYKQQYNSLMPDYGNIDVQKLGKIADFLLTLKK
ncbi:MAG: cytochrome c [Melioribacteraceae bacterium]|nr:cytochrome c [Melioribacteraceae bacterium]MCF8353863.1 cytochrome c [Melioribacteraceae bacterium]MCF8393096.1 cytochrome c [Melioribacteraceae bacterium]MCF8419215.1 cytochrome c [Melioribacteraceae bacterium]